jgi:hypothetical protein
MTTRAWPSCHAIGDEEQKQGDVTPPQQLSAHRMHSLEPWWSNLLSP